MLFVCSKLSNVLLCVSTWHKSLLCTSQWDPRGPWQNDCVAVDEGLHSNNCFIWNLYCFPSVAEAPLCPKSWCFTFAHGKRWEISGPHIHPWEDPQSNFRRLNLKSRLHPSQLHIWLSHCLHDGLLYCSNSCVASNAQTFVTVLICYWVCMPLPVSIPLRWMRECFFIYFSFFFLLQNNGIYFLPFTIAL